MDDYRNLKYNQSGSVDPTASEMNIRELQSALVYSFWR